MTNFRSFGVEMLLRVFQSMLVRVWSFFWGILGKCTKYT